MAPEQAEGKAREVGPAADVYALGAILYEQLTGRPPFVGATVLETLQQVKSAEPVVAVAAGPGPAARRRDDRPEVPGEGPGPPLRARPELADDLGRFLAGAPIVARPVPFWERGWKWARRRPAVAALRLALAAASAASLLGLGAVSYARIQDALGEARDEQARAVRARAEEEPARERAEAPLAADAERAQADAARNAALAETYRASISEARALRAAHRPGWRDEALGNLARLATLPTPRRDLVELRTEAVACLGDFDIREVARLDSPGSDVFGLEFLADGRTLATAQGTGVVHLWDLAGPSHVATFADDGGTGGRWGWPASFEPWPSVIRRPGGGGLIYNRRAHGAASVGLPAIRVDRPPVDRPGLSSRGLALDAAGRRLAVSWSDGRVEVLDAATGSPITSDRPPTPGPSP